MLVIISLKKPVVLDPILAPSVSAESSIILSLYFFAIFFIFGQLGTFPIKFGINKHFVFEVIFFSILSSSI